MDLALYVVFPVQACVGTPACLYAAHEYMYERMQAEMQEWLCRARLGSSGCKCCLQWLLYQRKRKVAI